MWSLMCPDQCPGAWVSIFMYCMVCYRPTYLLWVYLFVACRLYRSRPTITDTTSLRLQRVTLTTHPPTNNHPNTGLGDCHGAAFEELYLRYEREGRFRRQVRAQDLWFAILDSQIETGTPYMLVGLVVLVWWGWVMVLGLVMYVFDLTD